jgi:hypothetical protein
MLGDDTEIRKLREEWDNLPHDQKVDKFLWKMVWWHHTKHVPGSPPHEAINKLAGVVEKASTASDKLSRSITVATWVGGIAAAGATLIALINLCRSF